MPHDVAVSLGMAISICMIIAVSVCCYYFVQRTKATWKKGSGRPDDELQARIEALEGRVADIQDIVISIDDQLKRTARRLDLSADKTTDDLLQ